MRPERDYSRLMRRLQLFGDGVLTISASKQHEGRAKSMLTYGAVNYNSDPHFQILGEEFFIKIQTWR
jgi:hypothetical protein